MRLHDSFRIFTYTFCVMSASLGKNTLITIYLIYCFYSLYSNVLPHNHSLIMFMSPLQKQKSEFDLSTVELRMLKKMFTLRGCRKIE